MHYKSVVTPEVDAHPLPLAKALRPAIVEAARPSTVHLATSTPIVSSGSAGSAHAASLNRMARDPGSTQNFLLHLQRRYGNRHVQRVLHLARQPDNGGELAPQLQSAIESRRRGGQALDSQVQHKMESAFGADFSSVRVHTDGEAHALNKAVNAAAFTTGQDIFFRQGEYQPHSSFGQQLLAHELAHVVQQIGDSTQGKLVVGAPDDIDEQEAEHVAESITSGFLNSQHRSHGGLPGGSRSDAMKGATSASLGAASRLQRQDDPNQTPMLGSIGVHVQDAKTGVPIAGATVHIDQAGVSGPKSIDLFTDRNGDTTSIHLDDGNYTITVTSGCCDRWTLTMHVDGSAFTSIDALMKNCPCRVSSQEPGDGGKTAAGPADNVA
jgi:Domain of unknown function (DUF4157)